MSAIKAALENIEELTVDAIMSGANSVNDVVVYVNSQSPIKADEDIIEQIWSRLFAWHDEDLEYHLQR